MIVLSCFLLPASYFFSLMSIDKTTRALTPIDPLRLFLMEIQRYPLLSEAEERVLASRYRKTGDPEAAKRLVTSHLRLVVRIAMEYRDAYHNVLDLIGEGAVGLMIAIKKYDPDRKVRLSTYASWWIRSFILKYILDNFRLVRIGTTKAQRKLFYNLVREKQKIEAMGYYPSSRLLSAKLGVETSEIEEMSRRLGASETSLEAPLSEEPKSASLEDFIADDDVPVDEKMVQHELKDIFKEKLEVFAKTLKARELKVLRERLLAEAPLTLQEIADEYGISKERARQIEARIIEKLKGYMKEAGIS